MMKDFDMPTLTADSMVARAILAANRPVPGVDIHTHPERMARHDDFGIWYDPHHMFHVLPGTAVIRAIDDIGRFCWLVREVGEADRVTFVRSPYDAVSYADDHDGTGTPGHAVIELAAALRRGELRIPLAAHDFRGTGGLVRLIARRGMPGWLAAWLMPVMPQFGRAIWSAHRRTLRVRQARLEASRRFLSGPLAA